MTIGRRVMPRAPQPAIVWLVMLWALACASAASSAADRTYGGFGPEGARMREQLWVLPSGDAERPMRATLFRPQQDAADAQGEFPLVVINHGTDDVTRLAVSMPVYYWLSRWFVERGYAVILPQRRGHGATGGPLTESIGTCDHPDHYASGNIAADDIAAAVDFMTAQSFIAKKNVVVVGISTGGWGALALAARNPDRVGAFVNFAGGRGGHAYGRANAVCGVPELLSAAHRYAETARRPTLWFYAANDSYFGPELAKSLVQVWSEAGGSVEAHILPPYGVEGHGIADDRMGWDVWGNSLASFLARTREQDMSDVKIAAEHAGANNVVPVAAATAERAVK